MTVVRLTERQKLVLSWHAAGMKQTEMGRRLGVAQSSVCKLLIRALRLRDGNLYPELRWWPWVNEHAPDGTPPAAVLRLAAVLQVQRPKNLDELRALPEDEFLRLPNAGTATLLLLRRCLADAQAQK